MSAVETSGTQTAVISTEHFLATPTAPIKTRRLLVDATALAATETLILRFYGPVLAAGTNALIRQVTFIGTLSEPHIQSVPVSMPQGGSISLQQTTGTGRAFPWAIITLD